MEKRCAMSWVSRALLLRSVLLSLEVCAILADGASTKTVIHLRDELREPGEKGRKSAPTISLPIFVVDTDKNFRKKLQSTGKEGENAWPVHIQQINIFSGFPFRKHELNESKRESSSTTNYLLSSLLHVHSPVIFGAFREPMLEKNKDLDILMNVKSEAYQKLNFFINLQGASESSLTEDHMRSDGAPLTPDGIPSGFPTLPTDVTELSDIKSLIHSKPSSAKEQSPVGSLLKETTDSLDISTMEPRSQGNNVVATMSSEGSSERSDSLLTDITEPSTVSLNTETIDGNQYSEELPGTVSSIAPDTEEFISKPTDLSQMIGETTGKFTDSEDVSSDDVRTQKLGFHHSQEQMKEQNATGKDILSPSTVHFIQSLTRRIIQRKIENKLFQQKFQASSQMNETSSPFGEANVTTISDGLVTLNTEGQINKTNDTVSEEEQPKESASLPEDEIFVHAKTESTNDDTLYRGFRDTVNTPPTLQYTHPTETDIGPTYIDDTATDNNNNNNNKATMESISSLETNRDNIFKEEDYTLPMLNYTNLHLVTASGSVYDILPGPLVKGLPREKFPCSQILIEVPVSNETKEDDMSWSSHYPIYPFLLSFRSKGQMTQITEEKPEKTIYMTADNLEEKLLRFAYFGQIPHDEVLLLPRSSEESDESEFAKDVHELGFPLISMFSQERSLHSDVTSDCFQVYNVVLKSPSEIARLKTQSNFSAKPMSVEGYLKTVHESLKIYKRTDTLVLPMANEFKNMMHPILGLLRIPEDDNTFSDESDELTMGATSTATKAMPPQEANDDSVETTITSNVPSGKSNTTQGSGKTAWKNDSIPGYNSRKIFNDSKKPEDVRYEKTRKKPKKKHGKRNPGTSTPPRIQKDLRTSHVSHQKLENTCEKGFWLTKDEFTNKYGVKWHCPLNLRLSIPLSQLPRCNDRKACSQNGKCCLLKEHTYKRCIGMELILGGSTPLSVEDDQGKLDARFSRGKVFMCPNSESSVSRSSNKATPKS